LAGWLLTANPPVQLASQPIAAAQQCQQQFGNLRMHSGSFSFMLSFM